MEFLICMLLAAIFTGGRTAGDLIHAVKGTDPAHLKKAQLRAQQQKPPQERSGYASDKPKLRDVAAVYWGDAMADAIDLHNQRRAEKQAQRAENAQAATEQREPRKISPGLRQRIGRFGKWVLNGPEKYWQKPSDSETPVTAPTSTPEGDSMPPEDQNTSRADQARQDAAAAHNRGDEALHRGDEAGFWRAQRDAQAAGRDVGWQQELDNADARIRNEHADSDALQNVPAPPWAQQTAPAAGTPTGEVANYETAMAALDQLEDAQRTHLDQAQDALEKIRAAKQPIADTQATYRPAAEQASTTHESLSALNLDQETVASTGTIVDAMPPNEVDIMFDQLEAMEERAKQQVANAETAIAATAQARTVIVAKYGDAYSTVQSELAGDSRFLAGASS